MVKERLSEQRARAVTRDLLSFRKWNLRPLSSGGQVLEENEYKQYPNLSEVFVGKSKTGPGPGRPDFLLVESSESLKPILVIETKATSKEISDAIKDATHYGEACLDKGYEVLAVGVAGAEKEICAISVLRKTTSGWKELTLNGAPIDWIPSQKQTSDILETRNRISVDPEHPSEEVLASQANKLNEIFRQCKIKDEFRPIYVATFMLALWKGDVSISPDVVLKQINANAEQALQKAGKSELSHSLRVDDENDELAAKAWIIVDILKKLNIRSFLQEHDYLGQLYETFFRYTGGNTIGQYFTPRHIISFMCDIIDVSPTDIVFDPACGTGGFLIGALNRMIKKKRLPYEEAIKKVRDNLYGIESEPTTAALCITNMILRGDGKSGIIKGNCFKLTKYPSKEADCALMNPPFPHKKTDTPATDFIDRALLSIKNRGVLASIIPYSLLVNTKDWHRGILKNNTLLYVATLPFDLFNPYSSFNTAIIVLQKGAPHGNKNVFFCKITNDGFKTKKNIRIPREGSQLEQLLMAYKNKSDKPELCAYNVISSHSKEWSPEAFIKSAPHCNEEFIRGYEDSIRKQASFYVNYGSRILQRYNPSLIFGIQSSPKAFSTSSSLSLKGIKVGSFKMSEYFDVKLGGSEEIEDLDEGNTPIVSTSEFMNGVTEWKKPKTESHPPVITVATDGSTGSSFVQEYDFYAFYKVAMIRPKKEIENEIDIDSLYYISYLLYRERWRYVYARKFGKERLLQTELISPIKNGKPDFKKMAELTRQCAAFPIIESFRHAYKKAISSTNK